jgi:hypothetical protein
MVNCSGCCALAASDQGRGAAKKRDELAAFHSTTSFALPLAAAAQQSAAAGDPADLLSELQSLQSDVSNFIKSIDWRLTELREELQTGRFIDFCLFVKSCG